MASFILVGIIIAGIAASILYGTYMYYESQPTFILVQAWQPIQIGLVHTIENIGNYKGDEDIKPTDIFFKLESLQKTLGQKPPSLVVVNFIF